MKSGDYVKINGKVYRITSINAYNTVDVTRIHKDGSSGERVMANLAHCEPLTEQELADYLDNEGGASFGE